MVKVNANTKEFKIALKKPMFTVAAQNFCQKISKLLSKLSGKYFPALTQQNRDLSAMNDNGAITGMDAREDGVYITYVPADGADPVSKKLCDPDIKKHKITGKTFSVKASEISASKILGVGIEKFSYSVGVDNANWSYGCSISSSYSDDSASGSVSATWGGPAGAGNYNISATWIVYYLG